MFDIDLLIIDEIEHILENTDSVAEKAKILMQLLEYETEFPEIAQEIEVFYIDQTDERYETSEHYLSEDDKEFIIEYAEATNSIEKTKELINKLSNLSSGAFDYDEIISSAQNEISPISSIDSFETSDVSKNDTDIRSSYKSFPMGKHIIAGGGG